VPAKYNVQANLNPYAPPIISKNMAGNVANSIPNAEQIRKEHLATESAIAAFGWFHLVLAGLELLGLILGMVLTALYFLNPPDELNWVSHLLSVFFTGVIGVWQFQTGTGLRKLTSSARLNATILNVFNIPIGVGIWYFILAWSSKANVVFSDQYKQVVAQTPHLRRHITITTWILIFVPLVMIGLLVFLIFALALFAVASNM
jgi:hypothetical protein